MSQCIYADPGRAPCVPQQCLTCLPVQVSQCFKTPAVLSTLPSPGAGEDDWQLISSSGSGSVQVPSPQQEMPQQAFPGMQGPQPVMMQHGGRQSPASRQQSPVPRQHQPNGDSRSALQQLCSSVHLPPPLVYTGKFCSWQTAKESSGCTSEQGCRLKLSELHIPAQLMSKHQLACSKAAVQLPATDVPCLRYVAARAACPLQGPDVAMPFLSPSQPTAGDRGNPARCPACQAHSASWRRWGHRTLQRQ